MPVQIQFRRDTAANWTSANPTLAAGEMGINTTTNQFKIGDGTTAWNSLSYAPLSGTVSELNAIEDVTITSASNGQFLKWNGTAWVNDAIDLGSDTTGNYMVDVSQGTGITVTHTPGEGSTATIANAGVLSVNGSTGVITGVVTTADSGTVTSAMIADSTIVNGDISSSAAIAHSKLANITAGSVLLGNVSDVPTATALSGDVTVNSSGVTAIGSGVIVNGDISASAEIDSTKITNWENDQVILSGHVFS